MIDITNYKNIKAWPFEEAIKIIKKTKYLEPTEAIHFETGYGPSGVSSYWNLRRSFEN